jgi:hypothetical protein
MITKALYKKSMQSYYTYDAIWRIIVREGGRGGERRDRAGCK